MLDKALTLVSACLKQGNTRAERLPVISLLLWGSESDALRVLNPYKCST